jgi:hypothetical protein
LPIRHVYESLWLSQREREQTAVRWWREECGGGGVDDREVDQQQPILVGRGD